MDKHLTIKKTAAGQVVTCKYGHWITNYNGENLSSFSIGKELILPLSADVDKMFHCIEDAEYKELMERKKASVMEMDEPEISIPEIEEPEMPE